jgi:hypothetical protein
MVMSHKPGEKNIQAWVPGDLHQAVREKLVKEGIQLRALLIWFLEKWTGHKVETNAATQPPDVDGPAKV